MIKKLNKVRERVSYTKAKPVIGKTITRKAAMNMIDRLPPEVTLTMIFKAFLDAGIDPDSKEAIDKVLKMFEDES